MFTESDILPYSLLAIGLSCLIGVMYLMFWWW